MPEDEQLRSDRELEFARRSAEAMAMGGEAKLQSRREQGVLNARERVDALLDTESFREIGRFAAGVATDSGRLLPADGKVCGFGDVAGRRVGVIAYDFTVKGASSGSASNKKMTHVQTSARDCGFPVVYLCESTGVRMPDAMGGQGMSALEGKTRFLRQRESPWASAVLGYAFGSAAWHTVASDFAVFRKGSVMSVSSPLLVGLATGQTPDADELGGWKLHSRVTGYADAVVDTDEQAAASIRQFLSYLPGSNAERPPTAEVPAGSGTAMDSILDLVPVSGTKVYNVHDVVKSIVDTGSLFELKAGFARNLLTGLARINGETVGVIANNPMHLGGAIDANACDKATSFLVLCDSYNVPIVLLVDQPGFLIGLEAERARIVGRVINWMNALALCTVPIHTVIMRKSYGQAFVNMGGAYTASSLAAWYTAEVSFMSPASAASIVTGGQADVTDEAYTSVLREMSRGNSAYDFAQYYGAEDVIDPRDTRSYLIDAQLSHSLGRTGGVGQHRLSSWPTSF